MRQCIHLLAVGLGVGLLALSGCVSPEAQSQEPVVIEMPTSCDCEMDDATTSAEMPDDEMHDDMLRD